MSDRISGSGRMIPVSQEAVNLSQPKKTVIGLLFDSCANPQQISKASLKQREVSTLPENLAEVAALVSAAVGKKFNRT